MPYLNIEWHEYEPGTEEEIVKRLICSLGFFILDWYRDIKATREDIIKYEKRVNKYIEKYIKTDLRVEIPLKNKPDDDIAWCETRVHRKVDFKFI